MRRFDDFIFSLTRAFRLLFIFMFCVFILLCLVLFYL